MTTPQEYVRRPERVQAMRYTAETCEALHEWLGIEHHDEGGQCGAHPIYLDSMGFNPVFPGDWVRRKHGKLPQVDSDGRFRARYVPAGEGGAKVWDRQVAFDAIYDIGEALDEDLHAEVLDAIESALQDAPRKFVSGAQVLKHYGATGGPSGPALPDAGAGVVLTQEASQPDAVRLLIDSVRTVVPYVVATLPQYGESIVGEPDWGRSHLGRSASSIRQLECLLTKCDTIESALEAGGAGLEEAGLLPCPFCGGPASIETIGGGDATVMCKGDDCWCMIGAYRSEDEACDAWNVRAIESALPSAGAGLVLTDEEWARCRYWLEHFTSDEAGQPLRAAEQADIAAVLRAYLAGKEG